jgi:molybdopterin-containing oxidoreductase family membrane subunit
VDCIFNRAYCLPLGLGCIVYTVSTGIGTWGLNKTVGWAWDITNFVWWLVLVTLELYFCSIIIFVNDGELINRSAEAMTIFQLFKLVF